MFLVRVSTLQRLEAYCKTYVGKRGRTCEHNRREVIPSLLTSLPEGTSQVFCAHTHVQPSTFNGRLIINKSVIPHVLYICSLYPEIRNSACLTQAPPSHINTHADTKMYMHPNVYTYFNFKLYHILSGFCVC